MTPGHLTSLQAQPIPLHHSRSYHSSQRGCLHGIEADTTFNWKWNMRLVCYIAISRPSDEGICLDTKSGPTE